MENATGKESTHGFKQNQPWVLSRIKACQKPRSVVNRISALELRSVEDQYKNGTPSESGPGRTERPPIDRRPRAGARLHGSSRRTGPASTPVCRIDIAAPGTPRSAFPPCYERPEAVYVTQTGSSNGTCFMQRIPGNRNRKSRQESGHPVTPPPLYIVDGSHS
ncbi:hypothetical protein R1flu_016549 [Riccia fluitans]|uniref:Uncharacterized protein n=1 Tax=Riccia fluitans TaxID=41844 RepID=A0ABD1YM60_9MARC